MESKSKYFNLRAKIRAKKAAEAKKEEEILPILTEAEIDELLETVEASTEEVKELTEKPTIVEEKKEKPAVVETPVERAYNIRKDADTKLHMLDTILYTREDGQIKVVGISTKALTSSQPMAMYEIKKIFTNKLVLKKRGF